MPKARQTPSLIHNLARPGRAAFRQEIIGTYGRRGFDEARVAGSITEVLPCIYAASEQAHSLRTRLKAASLWIEDRGSLSGIASCIIQGLDVGQADTITIISHGTKLRNPPAWIRLRRLGHDVPFLIHTGHHVAELPDALVQAWWDEGPAVAQDLLMQAARKRRNLPKRILAASQRYPMLPKRAEFQNTLQLLDEGVHSYLEFKADQTVLNAPDLRCFRKQVPMVIAGREMRLDAYDDATKVAIEFDGAAFHNSPGAMERDRERDALLTSIGITPLRFTYAQVMHKPEWCREIIRATMHRIPEQ